MNDKKALRQIMFGAAYAVALATLMAYRFGSWWWTLTAFPLGILFCDVINTCLFLAASACSLKNLIQKSARDGLKVPKWLKGFLPQVVPVGTTAIWIAGSVFLGSLWLPTIGMNLGILRDNMSWVGADVTLLAGTFSGLVIWGLVNIFLLDIAPIAEQDWKNGKSFPPILFAGTQFCIQKGWGKVMEKFHQKFSAFLSATPDKVERFGNLKDVAGNQVSLKRLLRCLITTGAIVCWPFVGVIMLSFLSLLFVAFFLDVVASLLCALATNQSVSTGLGAFISAGLEAWLFPSFSFGVWSVVRFFAFMLFGGVLGFGVYKLREWRGAYAEKAWSMLQPRPKPA